MMRLKLPRKGQREVPSLKKLEPNISVEPIIAEVAKSANVKDADLQDRRMQLKNLRQMTMEPSYRYSSYNQK